MLTAGVDLAAEPRGTALSIIEWSTSGAHLQELHVGVADDQIISAASQVNKLGIDCALGWPQEFVEFMVEQSEPGFEGRLFDGGMDWRRRLAYRETDRHVRTLTGRWPLSVSTDRLGLTAMRAAGLLSKLAQSGVQINRTGTGLVAEVYPGATLRMWGFETRGYRTSTEIRTELLSSLQESAPWFNHGDHEQLMVNSCDAFDAVIAALVTRAVALGHVHKPDAQQLERAKVEGWINLPTATLHSLAD